ncbi:triacylglycerol lipase [Rhizina undulata]
MSDYGLANGVRCFGKFGVVPLISALWSLCVEVASFWKNRLYKRYTRKRPKERLLERLSTAHTYEEWQNVAIELDIVLGNDLWRESPTSNSFDYKLIFSRLRCLISARHQGDIVSLVNLVRSGLLRNLGNISHESLYNRSYAGSKHVIEAYISEVVKALEYIAELPPSPYLTQQAKLDLLHDTRQSFGRSTLVLQGGAIFGLYHIGVVKALHLRGLLPRIITGTAVGALIAALVGTHTEEELLDFLSGEGIDLTAFDTKKKEGSLKRKLTRFWKSGYFLDVKVLEECVRANVGDLTFEEAYMRTKRILNITVSTTGKNEVPTLLNYLTAPNVLVWSAACASNASSALYSRVDLMCKNENSEIVPWGFQQIVWRPWTQATYNDRDSPHTRIAELFNVNHFIVSQARPYLAPFLSSDLHRHGRRGVTLKMLRLLGLELRHRLNQLDLLGLLPAGIRRFLVDEMIPGASLTVVPDLMGRDFEALLENPDREILKYWILKGERSIWPAVCIISARCQIEFALDRLYQRVRAEGRAEAGEGLGILGRGHAHERRQSE